MDPGNLIYKEIREDVELIDDLVVIFPAAITIAGGILLLWTGCVIFKLTKSGSNDQPWFESEKTR